MFFALFSTDFAEWNQPVVVVEVAKGEEEQKEQKEQEEQEEGYQMASLWYVRYNIVSIIDYSRH